MEISSYFCTKITLVVNILNLSQSLKMIADLRDSVNFPYKGELDHAVGCAVKTMGPRHVLSAIPLQITGQR